MKKTLLILCALLLTSIGASAQIPYEFHAEDWVSLDLSRLKADNITYNADNTITVTPNNNGGTPIANNVALGNSWTYANTAAGITTDGYYITSGQTYYVIVGSDLSTATDASKLWWMNGHNDYMSVDPDQTVTLKDGDARGQVLFAWDISSYVTAGDDGNITLTGWTGGGLTATETTATISYIGFCTAEEVNESFTIPTNTYVHACTANESVWSTTATLTDGQYVRVDTWATQSDEIMSLPFMEYYAEYNPFLSDATIKHDQLTGLTPGVYEVSMDIRIIDYASDETGGNAKIGAGTKFIANGVSEDILTGSDGTEDEYGENKNDEVYGTYKLTCVVADGGTGTGSLDISLDVKDATYSWIMWKNLKVKYLETPSLSWDMTSAGWGTLVLPFAASVPTSTDEGQEATLTAYTASAVTTDDDGSVLTLTEVSEGSLKANTPYILSGTQGAYTFTGTTYEEANSLSDANSLLTGTFVDMDYSDFTADAGQYVLQMHEGDTEPAFYPITSSSSGVTLSAYHCYLTLSSASGVKAYISLPGTDDDATRIVAVESEEESTDAGAIYDLSGRKVSKAVKGVYIQNGKKVLVK